MKCNAFLIAIKICILIILFSSCNTNDQIKNDAFDDFKEERLMNQDSSISTIESANGNNKPSAIKLNEKPNEWNKFKNEIERKILANEIKIKKLKQTSGASIRLFKKIVRLETDNNNLKTVLKEYEEQVKLNLERFKERLNLEAIDIEFKLVNISKS